MGDFGIGVCLAVCSSIFIGTSYIIKKKGLLKISIRAGDGGYGYLKERVWWTGFIFMSVGETCNFSAYAFAPASLITPLGALSVLVSALLASKFLDEHLNLLGKMGCLICVLGATVLVIHAPKHQDINSMDELASHLAQPAFVVYVTLVGMSALVLICYTSPKYGKANPLVYLTITGTIGSLTVVGCKCLGVALRQTFQGNNQLFNWLTWIIISSIVINISVQLTFLNRALDVFNTAIVTPILYVIFTSCVLVASAILLNEWGTLSISDIVGNVCGFLIIVLGVFLLQAFKDVQVSLANMPSILKENGDCCNSDNLLVENELKLLPAVIPEIKAAEQHVNVSQKPRTSSFTKTSQSHLSGHTRNHSYGKSCGDFNGRNQRTASIGSNYGDMHNEKQMDAITGFVNTGRHSRNSSVGSVKGHVRSHSKTIHL